MRILPTMLRSAIVLLVLAGTARAGEMFRINPNPDAPPAEICTFWTDTSFGQQNTQRPYAVIKAVACQNAIEQDRARDNSSLFTQVNEILGGCRASAEAREKVLALRESLFD